MIFNFLVEAWRSIAPGLGNHLWQSTIFAAAAAGLALALRGNQARTRYWLWLAASLKFLFPFALLVSTGSYLAIPHTQTAPKAVFSAAFEQIGQPFDAQALTSFTGAAPSANAVNPAAHYLPLLLIVWLVGSLVVLSVWLVRWHRISAIAKKGIRLLEGPAAKIVAQLQENDGAQERVAIVSTSATIEPGIFGIFRPVLLWPATISAQLTEAHTESIVAHELCHVRRRDNLTATLHMLVESLFWFHPAVWWLGNRLVEDRERACDEAVVESGRERQVYAESILKVCEFCVESPLPCVPGVSGADLKRRIASIMSHKPARALSLGRKLLLGVAVVLAIAAPILAGALHVPTSLSTPGLTAGSAPKYSSVSIVPSTDPSDTARAVLMIGPDQFISKNASLMQVIRAAYGVEDDRVVNAPAWLTTDKYDFVANSGSPTTGQNVEMSGRVQKQMLQGILADRLKLEAHSEVRNVPVYALVLAKNGPKLKESTVSDTNSGASTVADSKIRRGGFHIDGSALIGNDVPIDALVFHLSRQLHRTVLNETGLSGNYEYTLRAPDGVAIGIDNSAPPESYEPALSSALTEQLGLTLEPRQAKMEVLVIDHVEKPSTSESQSVSPETVPHVENASFKLDRPVSFEQVTIKPDPEATAKLKSNSGPIVSRISWNDGELNAKGANLQSLIMLTYEPIELEQITGGPTWAKTEIYDIQAKASPAVLAAWPKMSKEEQKQVDRSMLENLLREHFGLKFHRESRVEPIYTLVVDDATKLKVFDGDCPPIVPGAPPPNVDPSKGTPPCGAAFVMPGELRANKVQIHTLLRFFSVNSGRFVENKTGLTKRYDVNLKFTPDPNLNPLQPPSVPVLAPDPNAPSLFDALVQQVGLKLVPQSGPVNMFVVDDAAMPGQATAGGR